MICIEDIVTMYFVIVHIYFGQDFKIQMLYLHVIHVTKHPIILSEWSICGGIILYNLG